MKRFFLALLSLPFFTAGAIASPTLIQCKMGPGGSGWVPDVLVMSREGASKSVTVSGPRILQTAGVPQPGKVVRDNGRRLVVTWKLKGPRDRRGTTTAAMIYRATIRKSDNKVSVSAQPLGFSESFTRSGVCAELPANEVKALTNKIVQASRVAKQKVATQSARPTTKLICKVTKGDLKHPYVPDVLTGVIVNGEKVANVTMTGVKEYVGKSYPAQVDRQSETLYRFGYLVTGLSASLGGTRTHYKTKGEVDYRGTIDTGSGKLVLTVRSWPQSSPVRVEGSCK